MVLHGTSYKTSFFTLLLTLYSGITYVHPMAANAANPHAALTAQSSDGFWSRCASAISPKKWGPPVLHALNPFNWVTAAREVVRPSNWRTAMVKGLALVKRPTIMATTAVSATRLGIKSKLALLALPFALMVTKCCGFDFEKIRRPLLIKKIVTTFLDIVGPILPILFTPDTMDEISTWRFYANALEIFSYVTIWTYWTYVRQHQLTTPDQQATEQRLSRLDPVLWCKTVKLLVFDTLINTLIIPWLSHMLPAKSICSRLWLLSKITFNALPRIVASLWGFWFSYQELKELYHQQGSPTLAAAPTLATAPTLAVAQIPGKLKAE